MARDPIIIEQTSPNLSAQGEVQLRKNDFDAAVWKKGTEVFLEKAMRCPCKSKGGQPLIACLNCGGSGWFFIQKRTSKMIIQSANMQTQFKDWSEELTGTVRITALEREMLTFMDRITIRSATTWHTQTIHLSYDRANRNLWGRTFYEILGAVDECFLFEDAKKPLKRLVQDVDYLVNSNTITIGEEYYNENMPTITVRYKHNPQYHVQDLNRDFMTQLQRSFTSGLFQRDKFPVSAIAKKAHYVFNQQNYFDQDGDMLELIDNSYIPNPCEERPNDPPIC